VGEGRAVRGLCLTERVSVRQKLAQPTGFCLALLKMLDVMLADEEDVRGTSRDEAGAKLVLLAKQAPPPHTLAARPAAAR